MTPDQAGSPSVPELELEFPPKPEFVGTARHAVSALVRLHEFPDDLVQDVKLAVSEACTTAISDQPDSGPIRVLAYAEPERFVLEVIDPGSGMERAVSGRPTEIDTDELPFDKVLSLPIIRGLVDEVAITPVEGQGVSLKMVLSLAKLDGTADA
jgi:serine/threonine-protein kinase RsbW